MEADTIYKGFKLFLTSFVLGGTSTFIPEATSILLRLANIYPQSNSLSSYPLIADFFQIVSPFQLRQILVRYIPSMAFQFALYDYLKRKFIIASEKPSKVKYFMCGGFAGFAANLLIYPIGYHKIYLVNDIL
jgi:hypothetical protein